MGREAFEEVVRDARREARDENVSTASKGQRSVHAEFAYGKGAKYKLTITTYQTNNLLEICLEEVELEERGGRLGGR